MILGALGRLLESLGALLEFPGSLLGGSWEHFGQIAMVFWSYFGAWKSSSKRFVEIMKNIEKPWKVLQKSRFGGSQIRWKISLEGTLGPILVLSWLVRAQVGTKRGRLTSTWRLRGTKLELQVAFGAPKEAPREVKRVRRTLTMLQLV